MIDPALVYAALLQYAEDQWDWGSWTEWSNAKPGSKFEVPGLGEVTVVALHDYDSSKNYDSWSEEIWIVFAVGDTLYRVQGLHTSYEGSSWENRMTVVVPKLKQITVYEESN